MKVFTLPPAPRRRPGDAGFTLVEIMIVVLIIGVLATLAIPALMKVQRNTQNSRFVSDLRVFAQAFETYAMKNGGYPANAGTGVVPTGMSGELRDSAWTVAKNSIGGRWNWDNNSSGISLGISTTNVTVSDAQMAEIDAKIDDGDLTTGNFQKIGTRFTYLLQP